MIFIIVLSTKDMDFWKRVVFADEKTFSSSTLSRHPLCWREAGTRFSEENVLATSHSGRITAAFWGWISYYGPGELVEVGTNFGGFFFFFFFFVIIKFVVGLLFNNNMILALYVSYVVSLQPIKMMRLK
jgi:hypothetical protein